MHPRLILGVLLAPFTLAVLAAVIVIGLPYCAARAALGRPRLRTGRLPADWLGIAAGRVRA